jgi:hypothetical protein
MDYGTINTVRIGTTAIVISNTDAPLTSCSGYNRIAAGTLAVNTVYGTASATTSLRFLVPGLTT